MTSDRIMKEIQKNSEIIGIAVSALMVLVSCVPLFQGFRFYKLTVTSYFFIIFLIRMFLFLWNNRTQGSADQHRQHAKLMFFSGILLLLAHVTFLIAIIFQMLIRQDTSLISSTLAFTVIYGEYAFLRVAFSIRSLATKRKEGLHAEMLAYMNWISALYTLALFTEHLLTLTEGSNLIWLKCLMISILGMIVFSLAMTMLIKSIRILFQKESTEKKQNVSNEGGFA